MHVKDQLNAKSQFEIHVKNKDASHLHLFNELNWNNFMGIKCDICAF